ncbi:DUF1015 domain-containing protein [Echinicola rosea]|uniref:DUF1015 domain-containing protein n=1 Tax=Echinicola rosea TaxID=1807691 RepID=A0ABQ1V682_9BACT|nr:DUF1015 domain-containing protein [Echinicola rosea]GGF40500.1 hypothetical protein GCM10011339_31330 [Echinicola rosea]
MAEIIPFSAWLYADKLRPQIAQLTVPTFDEIPAKQLNKRYQNPINSIHLSLPKSIKNLEKAGTLLQKWKTDGILMQAPSLAVYVYYQHFSLPGSQEQFCRKGFIAYIKAYPWEDEVILGHENTISHALKERIRLLEETQIQTSPTHGLYEDPENTLLPIMDHSMKKPILDFRNEMGIREQLAAVKDPKDIMQFINHLKDQKVILADGHHRLEASIQHREYSKAKNGQHTGNEAYNYHMMYFTNAHSDHLKILPTHRLLSNVSLPKNQLLEKTAEFFAIECISIDLKLDSLRITQPWTFILMLKQTAYKISLRQEKYKLFISAIPEVVKRLDISVLHYFFVDQVIGIPFRDQQHSKRIIYETDRKNCQDLLNSGKADVALLTREISIEEVMEVCHSGYTLPQKSTYFYPKTSFGLLFGSIKEEEFITYP